MNKILNIPNGRVLITKNPLKGAKNSAKFDMRIEYNEAGDWLPNTHKGGFIIKAGEQVEDVDHQLDGMTYFNCRGESLVLDSKDFLKYFN